MNKKKELSLEQKNKTFLLKLSRKALEHIFETGEEVDLSGLKVPERLKEEKATFVTLTKNDQLRGCIGKLQPKKELYKDIIENTYSAAFGDPRFPQLSKEELNDIKIEISLLTLPKRIKNKKPKNLLKKLKKEKPGVIIQYGLSSATYLPQVWEEIKEAKSFLSHLCSKAGLMEDMWKDPNIKISTYKVIKFKEK